MRAPLPLFALIVACTPDPVPEESGAAELPVDTGDSSPGFLFGEGEARITPSGAYEGGTVSLVWVEPMSAVGAQYSWGEALASQPVAEDVLFELTAPEDALLRELDPVGHPGVRGALFAPVLHVDVDGDGVHSSGEAVLGIANIWLFYAADSPSGIPWLGNSLRGWNAMNMDLSSGLAESTTSMEGIPLAGNLIPRENIRLGGEWSSPLGSGQRFIVHSALALEGDSVEAPTLVDQPVETPFEFGVRGPPPADHFGEWQGGEHAAVELPEVYIDVDGDQSFSEGDTRQFGLCRMNGPITVVYLETVRTLTIATQLTASNNVAGWNAVTSGGSVRFLPQAELASLTTGNGCTVPG